MKVYIGKSIVQFDIMSTKERW